jgi:hypothetical protein
MYLYCPKQQVPDEAQVVGIQADAAPVDTAQVGEESAVLRDVEPPVAPTSSKGSKGMGSKGMGKGKGSKGVGSKGMGSKGMGSKGMGFKGIGSKGMRANRL